MQKPKPIKILITGAAGQIAYSLIFKLINKALDTDLFDSRPLALHLLDLSSMHSNLVGVKMEIDDCAFTNVSSVHIMNDIRDILDYGVDYALLVGAKPRSQGMERSDLLAENAKIFVEQGQVLQAIEDVKVLVVGNPCNTNALVFRHNAIKLDPFNIRAMMRLDQNRAIHQMAKALKVSPDAIANLVVWGNHSPTMVPDFTHAKVKGASFESKKDFFQKDFFSLIQKRGASIINARHASSAASAASAVIDSLIDWQEKTKGWYSAGIYSQNNPYNIDKDLYFSFPMEGNEIVEGIKLDDFIHEKIKITEGELLKERDAVARHLQ